MDELIVQDVPPGLTEAARAERARFEARRRRVLQEAQLVSLSILVWGQNPASASPVAQKRKEIRDELERLGHNAMFSEDLASSGLGLSAKSEEFAQAMAVHLIIILVEDAPGALAEAHDFCNHPKVAPNVYILIPQRYRDGYSAQGAIKDLEDGYGGVYWYADDEISSCNVKKLALKRAEARRQILARFSSVMS